MPRATITATTTDGAELVSWDTDENGEHGPDLYTAEDITDTAKGQAIIASLIDEPDETSDPSAVREFLAASMDEERKALTKLMRYLERHGDNIKDLRSAYEGHQSRTARLYKLATRGLVNL